jgi:hypothetical protein
MTDSFIDQCKRAAMPIHRSQKAEANLRTAKRDLAVAKSNITEAQLAIAVVDAAYSDIGPNLDTSERCKAARRELTAAKTKAIASKLAVERAAIAVTDSWSPSC